MTIKDRILKIILWFSRKTIPIDFFAYRYPISVKGIIIWEDKVLLLKNERDEWDLPGGKLSADVSAEACLIREVKEETNLDVSIGHLEATFIYNVQNWVRVLVVVYQCSVISKKEDLKISGEHYDVGFFSVQNLKTININQTYKNIVIPIIERGKNIHLP
jgi:8-oxo-dGTP pyrophosphatase MutT (NUDIX family)